MDTPLILHVTTDTEVGGTETRLALFLQHADRKSLRHEVVTLKPKGKLASKIEESGVPLVSLGLKHPLQIPEATRRLYRIIAERRPQVVQSYLFHANTLCLPIARSLRVPLIVSAYASTDEEMPAWRRAVDLTTSRLAHLHLANCRAVAEVVRRRIRGSWSKFRLIYPGRPDPLRQKDVANLQKERIRRDPPIVLAVGRLHRAKGHDNLLEALRGVRLPWEAIFVGDGPERARLEAIAARLGISSRVRFVGEVENPNPYYAKASLFVLPSLWEGMPGALIEAMFWALPIVATAVGGVPEAVEHRKSALLASPKDPDTLSQLIEDALRDGEWATKLGTAAREQAVRKFGIESMTRSWEEVYLVSLASR